MRGVAEQPKAKPKPKVKADAALAVGVVGPETKVHWTDLAAQAASGGQRHVPQAAGLKIKKLLDCLWEVTCPPSSPSRHVRAPLFAFHPLSTLSSQLGRNPETLRLWGVDTGGAGHDHRGAAGEDRGESDTRHRAGRLAHEEPKGEYATSVLNRVLDALTR
jgi:hypothetical protein